MVITVEEAERIVLQHARPFPAVSVQLTEAQGRVLREDVRADRDLPPYDRVTMDGIAIAYSAWKQGRTRFTIEGTQQAGQPAMKLGDRAASCIQVMTGAVLPAGCDCVIPYEELRTDGTESVVSEKASVRRMQNVHPQGTDRKKGERLLETGCPLLSPQVEILASVGRSAVAVSAFPSVAVLSNGDELVDVGRDIRPYQVRLSNSYAIRAGLCNEGCTKVSLFHTRDDPRQIERILRGILKDFDVLVTTGGVSVGEYDFMPPVLKSLGVKRVFHKVSQRPGKPLWFGKAPGRKPVFALPGNAVSSLVCLHRYVLPFLRKGAGAAPRPPEFAKLDGELSFGESLTHFLPVRVTSRPDGSLAATTLPYFGSGDFASLAESNGFIELPREKRRYSAGTAVRLWRWGG